MINDSAMETDNNDNMKNNSKTTSIYFKHKIRIIGRTSNNNRRLNTEIVVSLKYLSNFWRSLDLPFINWEIELDLTWKEKCVTSQVSRKYRAVHTKDNPVETATTGATF